MSDAMFENITNGNDFETAFQVRCVQLTEDWPLVPLQKNRGCPTNAVRQPLVLL